MERCRNQRFGVRYKERSRVTKRSNFVKRIAQHAPTSFLRVVNILGRFGRVVYQSEYKGTENQLNLTVQTRSANYSVKP